MPLMEDVRYEGTVTRAEWITNENTGSRGLDLDLEAEGSTIGYVIYVTPKSLAMAARQFKLLGATDNDLLDAGYMENEFPAEVVGRKVRFKTFLDNYNNRAKLKVETLLAPATSGGGIGSGVADMFRAAAGVPSAPSAPPPAADVPDEDIPF